MAPEAEHVEAKVLTHALALACTCPCARVVGSRVHRLGPEHHAAPRRRTAQQRPLLGRRSTLRLDAHGPEGRDGGGPGGARVRRAARRAAEGAEGARRRRRVRHLVRVHQLHQWIRLPERAWLRHQVEPQQADGATAGVCSPTHALLLTPCYSRPATRALLLAPSATHTLPLLTSCTHCRYAVRVAKPSMARRRRRAAAADATADAAAAADEADTAAAERRRRRVVGGWGQTGFHTLRRRRQHPLHPAYRRVLVHHNRHRRRVSRHRRQRQPPGCSPAG